MTGLRRALWALAVAGVLLGLAVLAVVLSSDMLNTRGVWAAGTLLTGWGFIGVGLFAWGRRPDNRVGMLMAATGFAWLLAAVGFSDLPLLFTIGQLFGAFFFAVVLHLLLAFPSGRLQSVAERRIVWATYLLTSVGVGDAVAVRRPQAARLRRVPGQRGARARERVARHHAERDPQHRRRAAGDGGAGGPRQTLAARHRGPAALPRAGVLGRHGGPAAAGRAGRAARPAACTATRSTCSG